MPSLLSFGLNILADVFYPKYCFGCRRTGSYLCKFCITQIPSIAEYFCIVCNKTSANGNTHFNCRTDITPDRLLSAVPYQNEIISDMIISGKYHFIPEVFTILGALTAHALLQRDISLFQNELEGFVICPLPLHKQREKWRGFNQTYVTSSIIAQAFNLPLVPLLIRSRKTKTQKDLKADQRKMNMQNAFTCQYQPPEKVILIDDVITTGQTLIEATRVLKLHGAKTVWCISIAKD